MELHSTLYIKPSDTAEADALYSLLEGGEMTAATLKTCIGSSAGSDSIDSLFNSTSDNSFFMESSRKEEGYLIADIVSGNGQESDLLLLAKFLVDAFPGMDVRIKGQGEQLYFIYIKQDLDSHEVELRVWEEDDPEDLIEMQDWFNEDLPASLQENMIDFY